MTADDGESSLALLTAVSRSELTPSATEALSAAIPVQREGSHDASAPSHDSHDGNIQVVVGQ